MSLIYNATFDSQTRVLSLLDKAGNVISSCEVPSKELVDDITKPLTFRATQDGSTVKLTKNGSPSGTFQTSRDGGNTWSDYTLGTAITLNTGDKVSFRAKADRTSSQTSQDYFGFQMTGKIEAWHNVMSLYRPNDFATYNTVVSYAFNRLFQGCTSLTKAPALPATTLAKSCYLNMFRDCTSLVNAPALPVTTLANNCYSGMFYGCTSLTKAPALPETTLANNCYEYMFYGCTSLTKAPALPATTLASSCYYNMFYGCTALAEAPELPSTTLAKSCYQYMFNGCTSLTKAPALPATTLADNCYQYMFQGCTSLIKAPALPATKLATECYQYMFSGCTSLTKAPALPATTLAPTCYKYMFNGCSSLNEVRCQMPSSYSGSAISSYTENWLNGVSSTGTFYTNADANWSSGASGIPEGWTRVNESAPTVDDITKPLTFKATQDGSTVAIGRYGYPSGAFQTSRDGGNTWTDYSINTAITLNTGEEVSFRAKADRTSEQTDKVYFHFAMKGKIEAWHNVMSLYRTNDFATYESVMKFAFYRLFKDCTSLTKAPVLPATTLAVNCYEGMFIGCQSLTKSPALPETTLSSYCYNGMFSGCSSLNEVRCQMPSSYSSSQISSYASNWLSNVSPTGTFYTNVDANWPSGASGIPTGWTRVNEGAPTVDDLTKPLTFRATQDGSTVKLKKNGTVNGEFQTSRDRGNTWSDYTIGTDITLNNGDEVSFRAKADRTSEQTSQNYFGFQMTGKIDAWHNVMSLYRKDDFSTYSTVMTYSFYRLFKDCTSLTKAPVLPATTLSQSCYSNMFRGCTSLTKAPALPATDFNSLDGSIDASNCYESMFWGCTSLTEAPELPATTLNIRCYYNMFNDCTSLTKAPELPATILEESCYESMFSGCSSLTKAPALPATTLAFDCYSGMFNYCTSLVNAPALPATTLKSGCYNWMFARCIELKKSPELTATKLANRCYNAMFYGCGRLNEVRCQIPSTISAEDIPKYTTNGSSAPSPDQWLYNVSSTGTFYTNADANWPSGASGIPTGWTRSNI